MTTLLIDIDNTLLDFDKCAESSIKLACEFYGIEFTQKTFPTFTRVNDGLWLKVESGEITQQELYARRFNDIFKILNINFDGPTFEKKFKEFLHESCITVDNAKELLIYLKGTGKYYIALATNGNGNQQENRIHLSGLDKYINGIFPSSTVGAEKPTKEYFDYCIKNLPENCKKEVYIIGDSPTADIIGGKNYGLKTVWFDKKNTGKTLPYADYTVKNLLEIKNIL